MWLDIKDQNDLKVICQSSLKKGKVKCDKTFCVFGEVFVNSCYFEVFEIFIKVEKNCAFFL